MTTTMTSTMTSTLPHSQLYKYRASLHSAEQEYRKIQSLMALSASRFEEASKMHSDLEKMSHREKWRCEEQVNDFYYFANDEYNSLKRKMKEAEKALDLAVFHLKHEEFVQTWFNKD